ncbi:2-amino-4-hydroxy-6-hydroxymethyldihydropteridine diphosphokinase [Desulfarculus baarsii]|uniref:2-amino-4-hydroxy-6- hydroxymethyldihydropteridine diphosphokinase n=1 Tax=Desulfarculus baarsii TaxID=453230 RepID=UPI0002F12ED0|nr:2-amino-4-hydroxy-6-hydroxymethyldihydropteridine diphosphokinase [Desulfarculus baarsii]
MLGKAVEAYVGLGANIGDPLAQLVAGVAAMRELPGVTSLMVSPVYRTAPVGRTDQPPFVNAVARLRYHGSARALLAGLLAVEKACGRVRAERWGPRTLDLDLLLFGDEVIDQPELRVPHPEMTRRVFVLAPLAQLAPELIIPLTGRTASQLLAALDPRELAAQKAEKVEAAGWG